MIFQPFLFQGIGDRVICYSCNGGLKDWEPNDDVSIEHAVWFPNCEHLLKFKGQEFIEKARKIKFDAQLATEKEKECDSGYGSPTEEKLPSFPSTETKQPEKEISDEKLCIICCDEERSIVFLPCGHLVSCGKCAVVFTDCPTCRAKITGFVRAKFAE